MPVACRAAQDPFHQILMQGWLHGVMCVTLSPSVGFSDGCGQSMAPPWLLMFGPSTHHLSKVPRRLWSLLTSVPSRQALLQDAPFASL